jgi:CBS domain-containing protein
LNSRELQGKMAKDVLVHQIMTGRPIFYAAPGDPVEKCRTLMGQHRVRHLAVCDDGRVIGVLSIRDVLEQIITEDERLIRNLENDRLVMTTVTGAY